MKHIADALSELEVGDPVTHQNMAYFPLLGGNGGEAGYLTLDEALAQGNAQITEVSGQGNVPELSFLNEGDKPVLLLDGEELVGAKQNRVLNLSILAPAGEAIIIPVSCVESGRWRHTSKEFKAARHAQYARGRSRKSDQVSMSLRSCGSRRSNQNEVWADIEAKSESLGARSSTSAMADVFEQRKSTLDKFEEKFTAVDGQAGALFGINGRVVGVDVFDNAGTFSKLSPKLVRSYALDALDAMPPGSASTIKEGVKSFLEEIVDADAVGFPAVGLGEDIRLMGNTVTGGALVVDGRSIHLCAFPQMRETDEGRGRRSFMDRASNRQRWH